MGMVKEVDLLILKWNRGYIIVNLALSQGTAYYVVKIFSIVVAVIFADTVVVGGKFFLCGI